MQISVDTENCSFENFYLIEGAANSVIKIRLDVPRIVSRQSKKRVVDNLISLVRSELGKFQWIITGSVLVDILWYLNAVERQETDKIGDLDNISKPIQDALLGPNGILVDDSQIGGLYTYWLTRDDLIEDNIILVTVKFNNDYALLKKDLKFIQYYGAICLPFNLSLLSIKEIIVAKVIIRARLRLRKAAEKINSLGANVDNYLIVSEYEFHRTRLNAFAPNQILTIEQLNSAAKNLGTTFKHLRSFLSSISKNHNK